MILQSDITQWKSKVLWPYLDQVEHDLVLSRAICELYSSPEVSNNLVFRGGTALHKLYFDKPGRFSEDLDFVQKEAKPIGETISAVRACLDPWLGKPKWKQGHGRFTLYYKFETEIEPIIQRKVKVEINTREHFNVLQYNHIKYSVDSSWYKGSASIVTYQLEELLGTKLRALYQRRKGRDLFDFWYAFSEHSDIDIENMVKTFFVYMNRGNTPITHQQYAENLELKRDSKVFNDDIVPLLAPGIAKQYEVQAAYDILFSRVIPRMVSVF
ncbi:MAG: nucleotidyl transferase AbiEii/AbiGii toxin family protein [Coxiellaceae bacterium]|nr:nucleotidyl transferase AbiEii/AbiGii toxin family protein [Coxiellaceae bacterium]